MSKLKIFSSRFTSLVMLLSGITVLFSACKKDNDGSSGTPSITKVRLLDPSKKDSAFTKALPGTQVLIEGQNLGGITIAYFNDFEAGFNPVYNTNTNLIITIPSKAPTEATKPNVSNKIRLVTTHGEAVYDFVLTIPIPAISSISNENALPGEQITISGSSLWLIQKVIFPGAKEVTAVTSNPEGTQLTLTMPDFGNTSGPLSIQAKYGTVTTVAPVNKVTGAGMISNLEDNDVFNWAYWGANKSNSAALFPGNRGAYLQNIFGGVGANDGGWWNGNRSGNFNEATVLTESVRSEAAANYAVKFEVNTKEPWKTATMVLRFGETYAYRFKPQTSTADKVFDTKNKWQTVTVPLSEFKTVSGGMEGTGNSAVSMSSLVAAGGKVTFTYRFVAEADPIEVFNAAFDNFRIVKVK